MKQSSTSIRKIQQCMQNRQTNKFKNQGVKIQNQGVRSVQQLIFGSIGLQNAYTVNQIMVGTQQKLKTYFIKSKIETQRVFYIGHGFGGTSLMYFPYFKSLMQKGNIVLWQIRGMGLTQKQFYPQIDQHKVQQFYNEGLLEVINFYRFKKVIFISHSFGAYLTLKFALKNNENIQVQKCILLSPIGITPKQNDYKNVCKSWLDCYHYVVSWFGWTFNINYKSILNKLSNFIKVKCLKMSFSKFGLNQYQLNLMIKLFNTLTSINGGSQSYFYKIFEPRVLPKQRFSIQQIIQKSEESPQFKTVFYYGGRYDWVDKQGAQKLATNFQQFQLKILQECSHMLPFHVQQMQNLLNEQLFDLN